MEKIITNEELLTIAEYEREQKRLAFIEKAESFINSLRHSYNAMREGAEV